MEVTLENGQTKTFKATALTNEDPLCPESAALILTATSTSLSPLPAISQTDMNYITVSVPLVPITDASQLNTLNATQIRRTTTYYDGLGRDIQVVSTQASTSLKDIIQPIEYDAFGRIIKQYLPYTGGNNGAYKPNALATPYTNSDQHKFYNQNAPDNVTKDATPFAKVEYEASPMNRVTKAWGVGATWHNADAHSKADYYIYQENLSAPSKNVPKWQYDFALDKCFVDINNAMYPSNTLIVQKATDEERMQVEEFQDSEGRTVLKRATDSTTTGNQEILETMYVYDDFGQLRLIIPPTAVHILRTVNNNGLWNLNAPCPNCGGKTILETYCFKYTYDAQGRVIEIREPQKAVEYTVYDDLDRPILTQDENLRNANPESATSNDTDNRRWNLTKYDILGRPIYAGIVTFNEEHTRETLQNLADEYLLSFPEAERGAHLYEVFNKSNPPHAYTTDRAFPNSNAIEIESFEYLTVTYYDNYQNAIEAGITHTFQSNTYNATHFNRMAGKVVASKVKVMDDKRLTADAKWLYTVPYYDDRGRTIQIIADNHIATNAPASTPNAAQKGLDVMNLKYDYIKLIEDQFTHTGGASPLTITQQYEYDNHALKSLYHTIKHGEITYPKERLATYQYNEIGQMINKSVGNAKIQSIDYTFNIRGALTRINEIDNLNINNNNDLFAFQLVYEDQNNRIDQIAGQATNGLGKRQYNGLIAGQLWQSKADGEVRGYAYAYDGFGRLKEARYKNFNTDSPEKFSVSDIQYDKNGNITKMKREGMININLPVATRFGVIDDLTYTYKGNQITNIKDNVTASTGIAGDFQDRDATSPTATEYFYDENGNLITDDNKKVITLIYTAQGKVSHVKYADNSSITYTYDAVGIKLQKIAENVPENKTINTLYAGGLVYQGEATTDGELQFIATPEGKALAPRKLGNVTQAFAYEYNYTDHLGNLRMTFRESKASTYEATMETTKATTERREFANIDITRDCNVRVPNALGRVCSAKVQASDSSTPTIENKPLGPWKSIPVVKGDKISVNVQAFTQQLPSNAPPTLINLGAFLPQATTYGNIGSGSSEIKNTYKPSVLLLGLGAPIYQILSNQNNTSNKKLPNAYLRIVEYDENGNPIGQRVEHVNIPNTWHPLRIDDYIAQGKGRIEVFVANESGTAVWFDEMSITHTPTLIAQETHYDPWGLELVGIGAQGYNRFTFNAQSEKQKELGGNSGYFFETDWRGYDAQVGRFWQVDKLAKKYHGITPYHFALNNPVGFNDPTGLSSKSTMPDWLQKIWDSSSSGDTWTNNGKGGFEKATHVNVIVMAKNRKGDKEMQMAYGTAKSASEESYGGGLSSVKYQNILLEVNDLSDLITQLEKLVKKMGALIIENFYILSHGGYNKASFDIGATTITNDNVQELIKIKNVEGIYIKDIVLGACHVAGGAKKNASEGFLKNVLSNIGGEKLYANRSWTETYFFSNMPNVYLGWVIGGLNMDVYDGKGKTPYGGPRPKAFEYLGMWVEVSGNNVKDVGTMYFNSSGKGVSYLLSPAMIRHLFQTHPNDIPKQGERNFKSHRVSEHY